MVGPIDPAVEAFQRLRQGDAAGAERICRAALAKQPGNAGVALVLGMIEAARGNLEEAGKNFERAATLLPQRPETHFNLGLVRSRQGRWAEALASFDKTLALAPDNAGAQVAKADALAALSRHREAVAAFDVALKRAPRDAGLWQRRGLACYELGEHEAALDSFKRSAVLTPNADVFNVIGTTLTALMRPAEAVEALSKAVALDPEFAGAYSNRGVAYTRLQEFDKAAADHQRAIELDGADAGILANYAEHLHGRGRNAEAIEILCRVEPLDPVAASIMLGNVYADELRDDEAMAAFDRALSLRPNEPFAMWCRGLLNLRKGNLEEGFQGFEWRSQGALSHGPQDMPGVLWNPAELWPPAKLFIHAEHGLGDSIHFARFVPEIAKRGYQVVVRVPPLLVALFRSLHPKVRVIANGAPLPQFDAHCPLPSLPAKLGITLDTIPTTVPYLHPDRSAARPLPARVNELARPRIGLCWSGNPMHQRDARRSIPLALLKDLVSASGTSFVSLQKDLRPEDRARLQAMPQIVDVTAELRDFNDTAVLIDALDLVVTVDTSIAHLAGALGKPVWILLPYAPDWRWLLERADSPWYPTARLFRQKQFGDWEEVLGRVKTELAKFFA